MLFPSHKTRVSYKVIFWVLLVIMFSAGFGIVINTLDNRLRTLQQTLDFAKIALFQSDTDSQQAHRQLLQYVGARALSMRSVNGESSFSITAGLPPIPQKTFFLDNESTWQQLINTVTTLFENNDTIIRVIGRGSTTRDSYVVEAFIFERPIRDAMRQNILNSSLFALFLALLVALVIIATIYRTLTSPLGKLQKVIVAYKQHPSDQQFILTPTSRNDEIGEIHNEFSDLQRRVFETLRRQDRLAAIGASVAKISHDLRSTIGSVSMLIDGLRSSNQSPAFITEIETIFQTLDRAIALCSSTLSYAKQHTTNYYQSWQNLSTLLKNQQHPIPVNIHLKSYLYLMTDPLHFRRVFTNLIENAAQAGANSMDISVGIVTVSDLSPPLIEDTTEGANLNIKEKPQDKCLQITLTDNGSGFSQKALENLFQPFVGSTKTSGNGLGLPLSREIIHDLGGRLDLTHTSAGMSVFQMIFPSHLFTEKLPKNSNTNPTAISHQTFE